MRIHSVRHVHQWHAVTTLHQSPSQSQSLLTEVPMGRGAQAQTQQMIDQQLSQQNAMNQQTLRLQPGAGFAGRRRAIRTCSPIPATRRREQSAITNFSQSALSSSFDALAQNAANRAARTRNSAGYGELIDSLARTQGQTRPTSRAKSNRLRQRRALGHAIGPRRPFRPLRHRHEPARPRAGRPRAIARRQRPQRREQRLQHGFGPGGLSFGFKG